MPILRIGFFFDGTGCNALNFLSASRDGEQAKLNNVRTPDTCLETQMFEAEVAKETYKPDPGYVHKSKSGSYNNPPTNIWYMYQNYLKGKTDLGYQLGIYVGGCGTYLGEDDDMITMGLGYTLKPSWKTLWLRAPWQPKHGTGVIDKTDSAIEQANTELSKLKDEFKDITFESIEYDLYGFSRGATSARHLANRIADKDKALVKLIKKTIGEELYPNIKTEPVGIVNMIGLFDSVAAILALSDASINISDSKTGAVKLDLTNVKPKHVLHLTAGHEMRYNFSLNRTLPLPNAIEIELPGSHSDVGGGYLHESDERLFISVPFYSEEPSNSDYSTSKANAEAEKEMKRLLAHKRWGPIWSSSYCDVKIVNWSSNERFLHHAIHATKLRGAAVIMRRLNVTSGLETVALEAMREYSVQIGGSLFKPIFESPPMPDELSSLKRVVLARIRKMTASGGDGAPPSQLESVVDDFDLSLARKYVHCSSFYEAIDAKLKIYEVISPKLAPKVFARKVMLTMRPTDDLVRREYDSHGNPFER